MNRVPSASSAAARRGYLWAGCTAASVGVLALVAALGESAAEPGLGARTALPPWDLAARPSAATVTVLLAVGHLVGAAAVLAGLRALAAGWRPRLRTLGLAGVVAVAVLVLVPPVGSADHLSYVAYGRIAAAGDDPYSVVPIDWRGGHDPVAGAVAPPWQHTPSVYGPVATAVQALVSVGGHGALRSTVWLWQLVCAAAFLVVAWLLDRLAARTGGGGAARARIAVLWTVNPLLLGQLVLGAHVDVLAAAFGISALVLALRRSPLTGALPAGALLGAAVATKAPYALFGLAAMWTLRSRSRREQLAAVAAGAAGGLAVVVPAHVWAGPHVFDQLRRASRYTSLATPWRAVANLGDVLFGTGALAPFVAPAALALAALLVVPLGRRIARLGAGPADSATSGPAEPGAARAGAQAALALTAAWALTAPYALPWYDAMVWGPLALVAASPLDRLILARLAVLALAYVPGRVVGLTPTVERLTLGFRSVVAPVLVLAVVGLVARWAVTGEARLAGPPGSGVRAARRRPAAPPAP